MKKSPVGTALLVSLLIGTGSFLKADVVLASDLLPAPASSDADRQMALTKTVEIETLWKDGKKPQAFKTAETWLEKDENSPYPWVALAALNQMNGNPKKTLSYTKKALAKWPQCADAYFWRGKAYESLKKPLEAANEYRTALAADKKFEQAQVNLDRVLAEMGSVDTSPASYPLSKQQ